MPVVATIESRMKRLWVLHLMRVIHYVLWFVWILFADTLQSEIREMRSFGLVKRQLISLQSAVAHLSLYGEKVCSNNYQGQRKCERCFVHVLLRRRFKSRR